MWFFFLSSLFSSFFDCGALCTWLFMCLCTPSKCWLRVTLHLMISPPPSISDALSQGWGVPIFSHRSGCQSPSGLLPLQRGTNGNCSLFTLAGFLFTGTGGIFAPPPLKKFAALWYACPQIPLWVCIHLHVHILFMYMYVYLSISPIFCSVNFAPIFLLSFTIYIFLKDRVINTEDTNPKCHENGLLISTYTCSWINRETQLSRPWMALRPRCLTVTQCVWCISANTRPHQLYWGDWECVYCTSRMCNTVGWPSVFILTQLGTCTCTSSLW